MMTRLSWGEARRYVLGALAVALALLVAGRRSGWLALGASGAVTLFFRDPDRELERDPSVVYAAADGIVTSVDTVAEPWLDTGEGLRISTFLSLHDVHVNRSPVAGRIADMVRVKGGYAPALARKADANNRNRIAIDGDSGRVVVVQISGLIARKIAPWVGVGDSVAAGQRIGLIHFGSRTDVLLPPGAAEPLVQVGDRVRAGLTPLARYRPGGETACETS
jgi:phosphatidylserine decarboxylase